MTESTTDTTSHTGHTFTLAAGVAVVACLVSAAVALVFKGWSTPDILALLTGLGAVSAPLVAAVGKLVTLDAKQDAQSATIAKIDHQTNGVLTAKIEDAVTRALNNPIGYEPTDQVPE